jgi:phosphonate transport system ATP-binding protein
VILTVAHLTKLYPPRTVALDDVSFTVAPGSFTAVLGPSGAGKTTLLRCILRLTPPDKGQVWFEGSDLAACSAAALRQARGRIALVTQQFNLVRRRSALENCLAGRLRELPLWRCILGRYPEALLMEGLAGLARVGLLDVAFRRADQLSGGQQQRVAVARALTQKARLLLADEPIASLDPESAHTVLGLLRSLCKEDGLTVLCNLHQVAFARQYSDRILGMRDGKVVFDRPTDKVTAGDVDDIYRRRGTDMNETVHRRRILFVCVENSNRSQMAEAFARMHGGDRIEAHSAGSRPLGRINPRAVEFMREVGYDLTTHSSKALDAFAGQEIDVAVTMGCGDACPMVRARRHEEWNIPDPKEMPAEQYRQVRDLIETKVKQLLSS